MLDRPENLAAPLTELDQSLARLLLNPAAATTVQRWHSDAQALLFHLRSTRESHLPLVAVLGGTGTGKSTLVNRLLEANASAASFRRTFTTGPIAIARRAADIPEGWLDVPRQIASTDTLPVRGQFGQLIIVQLDSSLSNTITLVDTPDLDGDQPVHHAEADRIFRWAEALLFVVTPEKYQMTELLPYYRLARRYALPSLFVMNKCEHAAMLEDFRKQLAERDWPDARIFAVARDDAAYEPPPDASPTALRQAAADLAQAVGDPSRRDQHAQAIRHRANDLLSRLRDQIIAPLRHQRHEISRLNESLTAMAAPLAGVDVSPVAQQLQRHLQEQSVLYLMGPQRILRRVRQVPGLLARLPRTAWDMLVRGQTPQIDLPAESETPTSVPDFAALLADQFRILQSRIDDLLRTSPVTQAWLDSGSPSYQQARLAPEQAGQIAIEELAELKAWLEQRWHKSPRDTAVLERLLRILPGGEKLTRWSEAAPYLLAVVLAAHGAFFGHIDLLILGSFSLATWLGEKLSNEVTTRTRHANRRIAERYAQLAREQIQRICQWLEQQVPSAAELLRIETLADQLAGRI